jgi:hypothetical protein
LLPKPQNPNYSLKIQKDKLYFRDKHDNFGINHPCNRPLFIQVDPLKLRTYGVKKPLEEKEIKI